MTNAFARNRASALLIEVWNVTNEYLESFCDYINTVSSMLTAAALNAI